MLGSKMLSLAGVAALLASAGDFMLLASGDPAVPEGVLALGCLLGVLFIPFYAAGYFGVASLVAREWPRAAMWIRGLGLGAAFLGATIHGMTSVIISAVRTRTNSTDPAALLEPFALYLAPLWILSAVAILIVSVLFTRIAISPQSGLPRTAAGCSPAALLLLVTLAGLPTEWGRAFLIPAGPNLIHIVFFAILARLGADAEAAPDQEG